VIKHERHQKCERVWHHDLRETKGGYTLTFISNVHAMGLPPAQGIMLTEAFYWNLNDETRRWSKAFYAKAGKMPSMFQAGMYSATLHYLNAIQKSGSDETHAIMAEMKVTPVNDVFVKNGHIRPDCLHVHGMYLMQVSACAFLSAQSYGHGHSSSGNSVLGCSQAL
jgi:hypothetical protein